MTNEIVVHAAASHEMFLPVMNIETCIQRRKQLVEFTQSIMKAGHDFGKIPGTDKNVLLKPGAEKLVTFFGLTPVFVPTSTIQDWTGEEHGGEPLFYYRYKCELWRMGSLLSTGEGSCSSRETKYRYRKGERVCPHCGAGAIIKGKTEYGGGWLCFRNKGGCGAKFGDKDTSITGQEVGRVFNPDIADLDNTILKMAQKRSLIAAVLIGVNASEFFTQDMEDFIDIEPSASTVEVKPAPAKQHPEGTRQPPIAHRQTVKPVEQAPTDTELDAAPELNPFNEPVKPAPPLTQAQKGTAHALGMALYGTPALWEQERHIQVADLRGGNPTSASDLTEQEAAKWIDQLEFLAMEECLRLVGQMNLSAASERTLIMAATGKPQPLGDVRGVGLSKVLAELVKAQNAMAVTA